MQPRAAIEEVEWSPDRMLQKKTNILELSAAGNESLLNLSFSFQDVWPLGSTPNMYWYWFQLYVGIGVVSGIGIGTGVWCWYCG